MEWAIVVLSICLIVAIYIILNILKKHDRLEDTVLHQDDIIKESNDMFKIAQEQMKAADSRGGFESDDEVGQVFTIIKNIISLLEGELESKKW
jgi:hypothetical protein